MGCRAAGRGKREFRSIADWLHTYSEAAAIAGILVARAERRQVLILTKTAESHRLLSGAVQNVNT